VGAQRPHPLAKQIRQVADSIRTFGFTSPVLIDAEHTILAGHCRVEAAKLLGLQAAPCIRIETLTPAEKRAYVIADNKHALNAGWDEDLLAEELKALLLQDDLGFDIGVTGFSIPEIDSLVEGLTPEEPGDPEDDWQPESDGPTRCLPGDVWRLGRHRLICGDALDPAVADMLMEGRRARMVFSDPPYNVRIDGHVGGSGRVKHREFAMASGEMSTSEFTAFLRASFRNLANACVDGAIVFICMDWRHVARCMTPPTASSPS
jgi:hypothetical protein